MHTGNRDFACSYGSGTAALTEANGLHARQDKVGQGMAGQDEARQGRARQGKCNCQPAESYLDAVDK